MRRGLLFTGVALVIISIVIFLVGGFFVSKPLLSSISNLTSFREVVLGPGESLTVANVTENQVLMVIYNDSLGLPLMVNESAPGILRIEAANGMNVLVYSPSAGSGILKIINNYTTPLSVKYGFTISQVSSLIGLATAAIAIFAAIIVFVVGFILTILGAVLKPKARVSA